MTYTREQLERMKGFELSRLVAESMGWVTKNGEWYRPIAYGLERMTDGVWNPALRDDHSRRVQTEAIKKNAERYVKELANATGANVFWDGCEGNMFPEGIVWMLQATPRQITIAAILTLQSGGAGDE